MWYALNCLNEIYHTDTKHCLTDVIWVILTVVDSLDGLSQQLSHLGDLGSPPRTQTSQVNPFHPIDALLQVSRLKIDVSSYETDAFCRLIELTSFTI